MKKDLLSKWLESKAKEKKERSNETTNKYPLAYNQQALYFLCQVYPESPFYNLVQIYRFSQGLNVDAFISAFNFLIEQHEVLRTKFVQENGIPVQIIVEKAQLMVLQHTLQGTADSDDRAEQLIIEDARLPFDLSNPCLLRISLVELEHGQYAVGVIVHHIIMDMWSMELFMKEAADTYRKIVENRPLVPRELPTTYGRYAEDQANRKFDKSSLNYWVEKLQYAEDVLSLPSDFQRPARPTFNGGVIDAKIPPAMGSGIRSLCKRYNVTPFVILISLYYVLLYKYSRNKSVNIGVPFSNRQASELENIIGFFDETLILSAKIEDITYAEFIGKVKATVFEGFEYRQVPLEEIVKAIQPDRQAGINPLFQVMFIYYKLSPLPSFGEQVGYTVERLDLGISKFDLSLFVGEDESGFETSFEYSGDLFQPATVRSFAGQYLNLLAQVIDKPDMSLKQLRLLAGAELHQVIHAWNDTVFKFDTSRHIMDLIRDQVEHSANKIALADQNTQVSYQSLHENSEIIASYLIAAGVNKGDIVGLFFDRSVKMIISMLGVMKAGAAYLPLDPEYPSKRIRTMAEDAQAVAIIGETGSLGTISGMGCPVYAYDQILEAAFEVGDPVEVGMDDLAYVIYTSGSTGKPKGVAVTHLNLLNSTVSRHRYYSDQPGQFLLFSSFSFDSSVAGIFWTLSSGGKLVISQRRLEQDMEALGKVFEQEEITHTLLLPALYGEVLQSVSLEKIKKLKCVIVAGEACHEEVPRKHFAALPQARLYNEYGPTEAAVWATVEEINPDGLDAISIGKPIGNTEVFILDADMQPVPPGIPGEIYIGGLNVARGYLNNQEATAHYFLDNPLDTKSDRLYKTGDLGKYGEAGKIIFLGRADEQIKIRGHRVELIEIEKQVKRFPGIEESVVKMTDTNGRDGRIMCYFTQSDEVDESKLRSQLHAELPNYMVPSAFIALSEMPRLPNGKVDAKQLKSHEVEFRPAEIEPPDNSVEQVLHEIWTEVLKNQHIGIHDNFFEIGGDSILSIRIISKARNLGIKIDANQIFEHQTICALAKSVTYVDEETETTKEQYVGESSLTPFQQRLIQASSSKSVLHFQGYRIAFRKIIPEEHFRQSMEELIDAHEALRLTLSFNGGAGKANYKNFEASDFLEHADIDTLTKDLERIKAQSSLESRPLFKLILIRDSPQTEGYRTVVLLAHRLILDDASWSLLIDHLISCLEKHAVGERLKLKRARNTFTAWTKAVSASEMPLNYTSELDYWKQEIKTESRLTEEPNSRAEDCATNSLDIEGMIFKKLMDDALVAYNLKIHELLKIAYAMAIRNFTDLDNIVIWMEKDGRMALKEGRDFSATVGCFTSHFPLYVELGQDMKSAITNVKEKYRSVPSAGMSYDYLRYSKREPELDVVEKYFFSYSDPVSFYESELIDAIQRFPSADTSGNSTIDHFIHLHCGINADSIHCLFTFDRSKISKEAIDKFLMNYKDNLHLIIEHCSKADRQYTPGDFPEADLSGDDLNTLMDQL